MIQVIYASAAAVPFSPEALRLLLSKARSRNAVYDVSGMLLYNKGSFLQVLEGPESGVRRILESVYRDPRHANPRTLSELTVTKREFQAWSMGFIDTGAPNVQTPGHVNYHSVLPTLPLASTTAKQYLRFFQEGLYRQGSESGPSLSKALSK